MNSLMPSFTYAVRFSVPNSFVKLVSFSVNSSSGDISQTSQRIPYKEC